MVYAGDRREGEERGGEGGVGCGGGGCSARGRQRRHGEEGKMAGRRSVVCEESQCHGRDGKGLTFAAMARQMAAGGVRAVMMQPRGPWAAAGRAILGVGRV